MHILISNDDGYSAQGLQALAAALSGHVDITVVAPESNRSCASNSLTLEMALRVSQSDNGFFKVNGTPTDCVHLAVTGLLEREPDMVFSGINHGANLGDDVVYSGTVAAATEGRFLGLPAVAISLASTAPRHFETAGQVAVWLLEKIRRHPLPSDTILNVNVPDLPWNEIKGFKSCRLGNRHKAEPVIRSHDPRGREIFWIGAAGPEQDAGPGTDFHAIREGYVSITPLQIDLTNHQRLEILSHWLKGESDG